MEMATRSPFFTPNIVDQRMGERAGAPPCVLVGQPLVLVDEEGLVAAALGEELANILRRVLEHAHAAPDGYDAQ